MSVVLESANRINALKSAVEAVTGQSYDNLTQGIQALKDGYNVSSGGGVEYTDIIYNDDDTVTLIDKKGTEHTIACEFDDNRIISLTYDGTELAIIYNGDELVSVGETEVNVADAFLDNGLETLIDQSGVLDSTEGTVEDKVEQLIDYANFKNIIQESINANNSNSTLGYISVFRNTGIKDVSMFDFSKTAWLSSAFQNTQIEELELDIPNVVYIDDMCNGCKNLKRVVLKNMGSAVKSVRGAFYNNFSLESVGILNFEGTTNTGNFLAGCNSLRDISFVPETIKISTAISSPVLIKESISGEQGIINGLNSEVTGQKFTLSRNAVKKAFETSEGANDGDTSETWNALVTSKPNWTITLS